MSFRINEDTLGIWYVAWEGANWMASAWRTENGPAGGYRFRYYKDGKTFHSTDEMEWYDLEATDGKPRTEQQMIDAMTLMADSVQQTENGKKWELLRGGSSFEQFMEQFKTLPFVAMQTLSEKECRFRMEEHGANVTVTAIHKETGRRASATGPAARKQDVKMNAMTQLGNMLFGRAPS